MCKIKDDDLKDVTGGMLSMKNPVAGMSREEAEHTAIELGEGQDMGSWKTMSGEQFMKWWEASNQIKKED